jgi:transcriptional regulator with XRE-family HTH domain
MKTNRLRELRIARRMSQLQLAVTAGTTPAHISVVERYFHYPRSDLRRRIARALGVDERDIWPEASEEAEG